MSDKNIVLNVNGIEVIYNHVILVLKGVSLQVPEQGIVSLLGGNGAGKTTTLRAISNLLKGERGDVTKGSIELRGERIENLTPADLVNRGVVQVMEGRHCFAHLSIEDNLLTGSYTRKDKGEIAANLDKVYTYFPRLKTRRTSQAAYTSGGEQQMCAIGRALMTNPSVMLLDEPSMGLAPQIVEEVFNIVKDLNEKEKVTFLSFIWVWAVASARVSRMSRATSAASAGWREALTFLLDFLTSVLQKEIHVPAF